MRWQRRFRMQGGAIEAFVGAGLNELVAQSGLAVILRRNGRDVFDAGCHYVPVGGFSDACVDAPAGVVLLAVFPREVEDVNSTHEAASMVMVIGVHDDKWGEAVKAVVVLRPGYAQPEALTKELRALVREAKGAQQSPKSIDYVDDVPLTPVGTGQEGVAYDLLDQR